MTQRLMVCNRVLINILLMVGIAPGCFSYDAYVAVPVADLCGQPLPKSDDYETIPFSFANKDYLSCPRMHQILYHERVHVIADPGDHVYIAVPNVFYTTPSCKKPESRFWTLKKYLIPADELIDADLKLPTPHFYTTEKRSLSEKKTVTLTQPYYDPSCGLHFSAGTRFVCVSSPTSKKKIAVYLLDPQSRTIINTELPAKICIAVDTLTRKERQAFFIQLIRSWIDKAPSKHYIPYVWGGASILTYAHPKAHTDSDDAIKTGCDCSGLIFRAAQIAGIPYFFKNSYTALQYLTSLSPKDSIQKGDIIWVPGHIMIVSDLQKNRLFEERSYDHGYGKLQELSLAKVFKGIDSYKDLLYALHTHQPLSRIDKAGSVRDIYKEFKILRFASVWDITY